MYAPTTEGPACLEWRIRAFFLGAVLGLAGIYFEISWLLIGGLVVLLGGMALRFLPVRGPDAEKREPKREPGAEAESGP